MQGSLLEHTLCDPHVDPLKLSVFVISATQSTMTMKDIFFAEIALQSAFLSSIVREPRKSIDAVKGMGGKWEEMTAAIPPPPTVVKLCRQV